MKAIWLGLTLLLTAGIASAQTASVIELKPEDTAKAQEIWNAKQKADADWDAEQLEIARQYTIVLSTDPDAGDTDADSIFLKDSGTSPILPFSGTTDACHTSSTSLPLSCFGAIAGVTGSGTVTSGTLSLPIYHVYRKEFENGFEFSKDFKFIVPKLEPVQKVNSCTPFFTTTN